MLLLASLLAACGGSGGGGDEDGGSASSSSSSSSSSGSFSSSSSSSSSSGGSAQACDAGTTATDWTSSCSVEHSCLSGEWAMHNVTWDYRNPDGSDQGAVYRNAYGPITDTQSSYSQRRLRLT